MTVRILQVGNSACLTVEDNGIGTPLDERKRVFERFYRLPGNQKTGSGLSLSIVSEIVQLHHAAVTVDDGINKTGTSFQVKFSDSS